ncbi:MAG: cell division protein FtsX [Myxococcaceae bacterium]
MITGVAAKSQHFWRSALFGMRQSPFVHFVAVVTIAIALFATGLARNSTRILESLIGSLGGEVEMTIYLADSVSPEDAAALTEQVKAKVGGAVTLVQPEVAMGRLAVQLGELGAVLKDLPSNPLPRSIEVQVPQDRRTPETLKAIADELRKIAGVTGVDYGEEAVARLSAIAAALRLGGLAAFLIVVIATVIIVASTLQLAIYARREEIEIQKLVGATDSFVKAPFLIEGLMQGLLGAGIAIVGLMAFSAFAGPRAVQLFGFLIGPNASISFDDPRTFLELAIAGSGLGLLGSFVAVGRFLRV